MPSKADIRTLRRIVESRDVQAALAEYLERFKAKRRAPSAHAASKKQKRADMKERRAAVRAECVKRAGGDCEACSGTFGAGDATAEMDHMFGRSVESPDVCWMLCRACHRHKTENWPSRAHWDERFKTHCARYDLPFRPRLLKRAAVAQPPNNSGESNVRD